MSPCLPGLTPMLVSFDVQTGLITSDQATFRLSASITLDYLRTNNVCHGIWMTISEMMSSMNCAGFQTISEKAYGPLLTIFDEWTQYLRWVLDTTSFCLTRDNPFHTQSNSLEHDFFLIYLNYTEMFTTNCNWSEYII